MKVAVIGSGISGLACAWLLAGSHEVELFEAQQRLGGHAHTHDIPTPDGTLAVDSGFLVYNHRSYPRFVELLARLGVAGQPSDMSFGVRCRRCGLEYSTRSLKSAFAQPWRALDPRHLAMLAEVPRFNRRARAWLGAAGPDEPLAAFLARGRHARGFVRHFLLPLAGAVWSASAGDVLGFSTRGLLRFFDNHGWLALDTAPRWWTIRGGSRRYVEALARDLEGRIHLATPVAGVRRDATGVELVAAGRSRRFDRVVLATHADEALALLADPSPGEARALGRFRYTANRAVLHTDGASLPRRRAAWASWNCDLEDCRDDAAPVSLTYHLNRLQSLPGSTQYCVSLNAPEPAAGSVIARMDYTHPIMDAAAAAAQLELRRLSGQRHTFYAGAHLRYGFHEDGLRSALAVAGALGVTA
jgi:predicted NAD/FAD-binding protein